VSCKPILPFWFKQRQGKLEAAGENTFKAVAPQQQDVFPDHPQGRERPLVRRGANDR